MATSQAGKILTRQVRPIVSLDKNETRRRVLSLYKMWRRQVPITVVNAKLSRTEKECYDKIREEFMKNKDVEDLRALDLLIIKSHMDLKEVVKIWKQRCHIEAYWKDTQEPKPTGFLSKFIQGID